MNKYRLLIRIKYLETYNVYNQYKTVHYISKEKTVSSNISFMNNMICQPKPYDMYIRILK